MGPRTLVAFNCFSVLSILVSEAGLYTSLHYLCVGIYFCGLTYCILVIQFCYILGENKLLAIFSLFLNNSIPVNMWRAKNQISIIS